MGKNIILIGMSGGGKTTVGRVLAAELAMDFLDLDAEIERTENRPISAIFAAEGEAYFRDRETEVLARACAGDDQVIATGGGIVLRSENMGLAKKRGVVVYLERSAASILSAADLSKRPLLAGNPQKVRELAEARKSLYEKYADVRVLNEGSVEEAVEEIRRGLVFCDGTG